MIVIALSSYSVQFASGLPPTVVPPWSACSQHGCHDRYTYIWGGRVHGHGGVKGGGELGPGIVGGVQSGRTGRVLTPRAVHEWWCVEHALRPG